MLPLTGFLNCDAARIPLFRNSIRQVYRTHQAALDVIPYNVSESDDPGWSAVVDIFNVFLSVGQYRSRQDEFYDGNDPLTPIAYPVFENFDSTLSIERKLVGILVSQFYWSF